MFQNGRLGWSKQGLVLDISIWNSKISFMSIFLLLIIVKDYEIAMVFSLLCCLVKQWNTSLLRDMWYLFITFDSFGTYGSYRGKYGSQCAGEKWFFRCMGALVGSIGKRKVVFPCFWIHGWLGVFSFYCQNGNGRDVCTLAGIGHDRVVVLMLWPVVNVWVLYVNICWCCFRVWQERERIGQMCWWLLGLWCSVGFHLQIGFQLVKLQAIIEYERPQTFGFLGYIMV